MYCHNFGVDGTSEIIDVGDCNGFFATHGTRKMPCLKDCHDRYRPHRNYLDIKSENILS